MNETVTFIIVFALSLSTTVLIMPLSIYLGRRWGITAKFGGRRLSEGDRRGVSKLGGLAIFGGFMITVIAAQLLPVPRMDPYEIIRLTGLILGGIIIFAVGIVDDVRELSYLPLFTAQSLAAAIAILFQIFIEYLNNPLTGQQTDSWPFILTVAISYFWLVGMMNTVNWLDGMDGLAGGVAFIAGAMLFINSAFRVEPAQTSVSLMPLALMGVSLGFLLFNFYPGRVQMGGSAYFLGYILGALSIVGGAKMATILLVMGLPVMDVVWQIVTRLRKGRNPAVGDRGHVHFRLLDMGFSQRQIVVLYYGFCS
ncbi:MAG: undecaprenyl/decaprenyl-phosphate alpha-N-acetylglucosaminyl 1-phosphate transferase, partial [Anaerolineae bacterium]|nr:undecaprenyl/decaprenyl-phosphate alpha-N-acetylglucosaminyl 1-phosphate transferase [Anaerolineae bacterium]